MYFLSLHSLTFVARSAGALPETTAFQQVRATASSDNKLARLESMLDLCTTLQASDEFDLAASMSTMVRAGPSTHGTGLFAAKDLPPGTAFSLYPVHAIGDATHCIHFSSHETDDSYFGSAAMQEYWIDLPVSSDFGLAGWAEDAWISANPRRPNAAGWLGHLVNDAAACTNDSDAAVLSYYTEGGLRANAHMVPFGPAPLFCWVTSRQVCAGEELLGLYGHHFWVDVESEGPDCLAVSQAAADLAECAYAAHRGVEARYVEEIVRLRKRLQDLHAGHDQQTSAGISLGSSKLENDC
jgi:hypothetical protein